MNQSWARMLTLSLLVLAVVTLGCKAENETVTEEYQLECLCTTRGVVELGLREEEQINKRTSSDQQATELHQKLNILRRKLEQFNQTKDWRTLRRGLEETLDHECPAYKQLQYISYDEVWPMWYVGRDGYKELATIIVVAGQGLEVQDVDGGTILQGAALTGRTNMVAAMLNRGANMEGISGAYCRTAILFASEENRLQVVKLLARRGANLNASNCDGNTSLHLAAWNGYLDLVKFLVEAGANTTITNNQGLTALEKGRMKGRMAEVQYLAQFPH